LSSASIPPAFPQKPERFNPGAVRTAPEPLISAQDWAGQAVCEICNEWIDYKQFLRLFKGNHHTFQLILPMGVIGKNC
jgi:hypothetical protein